MVVLDTHVHSFVPVCEKWKMEGEDNLKFLFYGDTYPPLEVLYGRFQLEDGNGQFSHKWKSLPDLIENVLSHFFQQRGGYSGKKTSCRSEP